MKRDYINELNDKKLKGELKEGERLLWQGIPRPWKLLEGSRRRNLCLRWILCAVCFAGLTAAFFLASQKLNANPWLVAILLLVFAYLAALPALDARKVQGKTTYYLTDRRAITIVDGKDVFSLNRTGTEAVLTDGEEEGTVHALWGSAGSLPRRKYLVSVFTPRQEEPDAPLKGLVFYEVDDTEEFRRAVETA